MTDTERDRVVRELRRVGKRGDVMYRAAEYLERERPRLQHRPTQEENDGLHELLSAARNGGNLPRQGPAPDNTVRDLLTKKTLSMLDEERARHIANQEGEDDQDYIQWLTDVRGGEYRHIAKLIALTARFAGEMPHELIAHHARRVIKKRVLQSEYVKYEDQINEVEIAVWELVHQRQYPPLIGKHSNAAANYMLHNHINTAFDDMGKWLQAHPKIGAMLMAVTMHQEGAPKFNKRTYSAMSSAPDNVPLDTLINGTGKLLQYFSSQIDGVPAPTDLNMTLSEASTLVAEFVPYFTRLMTVLAAANPTQTFAGMQDVANDMLSSMQALMPSNLYENIKRAFAVAGGSFINGSLTGDFKYEFTVSALAAMAVRLFQLERLLPSPQHMMNWFYKSPHFNIELREQLITILSNHFESFAGFRRRNVDAWTVLVDPGLAGNARMACNDLASRLPRLKKMTMHHVLTTARDESDERNNMFTDYFCGAVAARWRATSVFSAQPYKTRNEQNAVVQALSDAHVRLRDYTIDGDRVVFKPRPQPTSLAQVRLGMQPSPFLPD